MNMSAVDVGAHMALGEDGSGPAGDVIVMYIHLLYTGPYGPCSDAVEQESVEQQTVEQQTVE